jgi:5-methylcytosine-specific restriction enzyme A
MFAIITENDVSQWDDATGIKYHFPSRYLKFLQPGTKVIYYKGRLKDKKFKSLRLSDEPHYFGVAEIGKVVKEENSTNYYADVLNFSLFSKAVPFKINNESLEPIPTNRATNYWRDGVRPIDKDTYNKIIGFADVEVLNGRLNDITIDNFTTTETEGGKKKVYTTVYERNPKLREQAIRIHGYTCMCCKFNFKETYGEWGEGYIHVHHLQPISTTEEKQLVNPKTDLVVVCANCHSMIHRRKDKLLSPDELRQIISKALPNHVFK